MRWLEAIESRLEFLAFPGLFKWLTMIGVVVFACQWANPTLPETLAFDRGKILQGEVWRLVSFAFTPAGSFPFSAFGALILVFATMISFLISDSLEGEWGPTRVTLYLLTAFIGLIVGQFLLGSSQLPAGRYLYTSMFLAFATCFPRYEFRLFLILPVQVRWLGWLAFAGMILSVVLSPAMLFVVIPALIPYAIWVLPNYVQAKKSVVENAGRKREFSRKSAPEREEFNRCVVCGKTDLSDPDLTFRTLADGSEYCLKHLPPAVGSEVPKP